ncbi:hypothetical protein [Metabacillus fastidiosus]|uniref:hypothetical protein n=1 Tax=Metabacillus fastidiosus TaxID=1458 RepID=UPI003D2BCDB8
MRLDKDKIKESLSLEDIHKILLDLGSEQPREDKEGNPIFSTICHNGNSHKLYYYSESKQFHCYSGCQKNMDIYSLVAKVKRHKLPEEFTQVVHYVANITGKYFADNGFKNNKRNHLVNDWDWLNRFKKKDKINVDIPKVNENVLDVFIKKPHELWLEEITYETQMKYEVCYYFRDNRIVTPHRDHTGRLIGLTGRALDQEDIDKGKKYMPISVENKIYSFPTMFNLYGLYKTKSAIKKLKKAAIFESQKSVMLCEDYYGEDNFSVATCGSNISNHQRDLLLKLGVEEVFICFDKFRNKKDNESDEEYIEKLKEYQENLLKLAKKFSSFVRVYILWDFEDDFLSKEAPTDRGKFLLEKLMRNKYEVKTLEEECI